MKEEIATIFEKMRTRECLDCGVVGFAGPPAAETCSECDLKYLAKKATAVLGGGEVLTLEEEAARMNEEWGGGLTVLVFEA